MAQINLLYDNFVQYVWYQSNMYYQCCICILCILGIYSDVIDKVDKEPPFDLHAYLTPPSVSTSTTLNTATNSVVTTSTASSTATTAATTTSTVTPVTPTAVDKPKKEPSKPKLYVQSSWFVLCEVSYCLTGLVTPFNPPLKQKGTYSDFRYVQCDHIKLYTKLLF